MQIETCLVLKSIPTTKDFFKKEDLYAFLYCKEIIKSFLRKRMNNIVSCFSLYCLKNEIILSISVKQSWGLQFPRR